LGERLGAPVVVVRGELAAWERGRYVAAGIPFVVPGEQLFLPMLMVDLRDMKRRTAPIVEHRGPLSWAAQVVVLRHLLADDVAGIPLTDLAARLGYSRMTMTNVQREIEAHSLCRVEPAGRAKRLVFPADRAAMWRDAQPLMRSPIRGREFLARCEADLPASGLSALAARTELAGPRVPVVAAPLSAARKLVELGRLEPTPDPDAEVAELELWHYDPALLSPGDTVDPLSLVLSLQGDADERVEAALVAMLEELPWSRV
jgi:hypothetical protein